MSGKVLVIPEDPQKNGYILRPFIRKVLSEASFPASDVQVLSDPRPTGYHDAVAKIRSGDLIQRWGRFARLWLFVPDADVAKPSEMQSLEIELESKGVRLLCCPAVPELEAWLLAGAEKLPARWTDMREERSFKEVYAEPFLLKEGNPKAPGEGRAELSERAIRNWSRVVSRCEELEELIERLRKLR